METAELIDRLMEDLDWITHLASERNDDATQTLGDEADKLRARYNLDVPR